MSEVEAHRAAQRELYGAGLDELVGKCGLVLGLSQARMAELLGISAPMLSQLVNGHRIKMGNPLAAHRLQVMLEGVAQIEDREATIDDVVDRLATTTATEAAGRSTRQPTVTEQTRSIQTLFRRQASAVDYLAAADQLDSLFPEIAELLRVYGAGRESDATRHLTSGN